MPRHSLTNTFRAIEEYSEWVLPYLNEYDRIITNVLVLRNSLGVQCIDSMNWTEAQKLDYKCVLSLVQSCDCALMASYRLLSFGLVSEGVCISRVLLEAYEVMAWCNTDPAVRWSEYYKAFFQPELDKTQSKSEFKFLKQVRKSLKGHHRELQPLYDFFNNYGAHLSKAKVEASVRSSSGQLSNGRLSPGEFTKELGMALDFVALLTINIVEEYAKYLYSVKVDNLSVVQDCETIRNNYIKTVQPAFVKLAVGRK